MTNESTCPRCGGDAGRWLNFGSQYACSLCNGTGKIGEGEPEMLKQDVHSTLAYLRGREGTAGMKIAAKLIESLLRDLNEKSTAAERALKRIEDEMIGTIVWGSRCLEILKEEIAKENKPCP